MNEDGESLMKKLLESEITAELVLLFRRNPGLVDEIDGIARRVGRTKGSIRVELDDLVQIGTVKKRQIGKVEVYSLDSRKDAEVQAMVGSYLTGIQR